MSKGSFGFYKISVPNFQQIEEDLINFLTNEGYLIDEKSFNENDFSVVGIKGSKLVAVLSSFIPLLDFFGTASRIQLSIQCRRCRKEDTDEYPCALTVRCDPLMELFNQKESFLTQSIVETLGDHFQSKRHFESVITFFKQSGYMKDNESNRID